MRFDDSIRFDDAIQFTDSNHFSAHIPPRHDGARAKERRIRLTWPDTRIELIRVDELN